MAIFDLREYARRGAEARVRELTLELAAIYRAFPDLRRLSPAGGAAPAGKVRRRRSMSAAQKREVSRRMKKYWANRRKNAQK